MRTYRAYRTRVTPDGIVPDGRPVGILTLNDGKPSWSNLERDFEILALPCFQRPLSFGDSGETIAHAPYSEEALKLLQEKQLPARGFLLLGPE